MCRLPSLTANELERNTENNGINIGEKKVTGSKTLPINVYFWQVYVAVFQSHSFK